MKTKKLIHGAGMAKRKMKSRGLWPQKAGAQILASPLTALVTFSKVISSAVKSRLL